MAKSTNRIPKEDPNKLVTVDMGEKVVGDTLRGIYSNGVLLHPEKHFPTDSIQKVSVNGAVVAHIKVTESTTHDFKGEIVSLGSKPPKK